MEYEWKEENMGLFDFLQKRTETPVTEKVVGADDVLLRALLDNETITREKAMTLPAVSGAVDLIANSIASMPIRLFKYKNGKVEEVEGDTRVRMLNGDTQDKLTAWQMKRAMVEDYLMGKGGYCYIKKFRNEVTGLYYVEDRYVEVMKYYEPIFKDYKILVMGEEHKDYEFLKLLRNTKDGASGMGLTVEISKELETAYQTLLYQLNMVKSGGNKKGFIKSQKRLGQEEINALKSAWRNLYANSSENAVVLNNGLEFQEASNSSVEMQLNESKRTLQDEINGLFHIYPNDFDMTFKMAIYPIVKNFETSLDRDLLLEKEKKNYFFELDIKEIIRANLKDRYESYKLAKETGFMTINEIRRAENMNYIEGMDVVNVGLGAVLYNTDTHQYFTPNTGEVSNIENKTEDMLMAHEEEQEFVDDGNSSRAIERFNDVHDPKTGKFGAKTGGSGESSSSGSSNGGNDAKIKALEEELAKTSRFGSGKAKREELKKQIDELKGVSGGGGGETNKKTPSNSTKPTQSETTPKETNADKDTGNPVTPEKQKQYEIIQKTNPMTDDVHTGIRSPSDIKSGKEAFTSNSDDYVYPDFTKADGEKALASGKITVYSSKPIEQGGFVSPSKMMAQDYAGGGKVYSQTVGIDDIAWIDTSEGQMAKI
jgi:HK97 family phage portal protein